jgi:metallophosphoesterase superfamily enzyme
VHDPAIEKKLAGVVDELEPETVVFLGDLVHAPCPAHAEREIVERVIGLLNARVIVVLGNHDRGFTRDYPNLPVEVCDEWRPPGLVAVHGDRSLPEARHVIAGHIHPALGIMDDAGASRKMPVFVASEQLTLLPAFSTMASGFDIRAGLPFQMGDPKIVAASGKRAVLLGPLSRIRSF